LIEANPAGRAHAKPQQNENREMLSCSMMTTAPSAHVAKVHDRQVVTLKSDQFAAWLDGSAGTEILVPPSDDAIRYRPVSKRISKVSAPHDDKSVRWGAQSWLHV
jgi:putative SOS response-associated peptidase YedK